MGEKGMEKTEERKEISLIKGLTIQKKKKNYSLGNDKAWTHISKRRRCWRFNKKNITKIYTLAVIIRDLNYKILRENYKKKKTKE